MANRNNIDRRQFLKRSVVTAAAVVGFPYLVSSAVLGKTGAVAASNRITLGCIGMGRQGTGNMLEFLQHKDVRVVAVCDVYGSQRQKAKNTVDRHYGDNGCATYGDFRELIARKDIDACLICTNDHWHVLVALEAVRNGKDIYLEKAMGLSVTEDRALRDAVNYYGTIFQFGTQQRSSSNFRFCCELVRNGRIGKLHTIMVGSPFSIAFPNQATEPVPEDLDYDMWLGPAPSAPYSYQRCRPWIGKEGYGIWYHISDYCQGFVAGWGIHHVDIAQWGNGSDNTGPVEIEGAGVFPKDGLADCAISWEMKLTYANGVEMIYMDAETAKARAWQFPEHGVAALFLGTEGWVCVHRGYIDAHPKSLLKSVIGPDEIHLIESKGHHRNFLDALKSRQETICPVESAVRSDTICHLSNIAMRLGRKLHWDPEKEEFVNDAEANRMLVRSMRSPWHL